MRTMIAIPCMDTVHTLFFTSMMGLKRPEDTEIAVLSSSLIYDARNQLAARAVERGFDRVLWLDSDMMFDPDLMQRLSADLDQGLHFVSGLYFTRKAPVTPCAYTNIYEKQLPDRVVPTADFLKRIPESGLAEIAGAGFGAVMMTTELIARVAARHRLPFSPALGFGEDLSFCLRVRDLGEKMYLDAGVRAGHIGVSIVNEQTYLSAKEA